VNTLPPETVLALAKKHLTKPGRSSIENSNFFRKKFGTWDFFYRSRFLDRPSGAAEA
jgi:hypothetical protein